MDFIELDRLIFRGRIGKLLRSRLSISYHCIPCHEFSQMKQNYFISLLIFVAVLVLLNFFFQLHISIFGSIVLTIVVNLVLNLIFSRKP